MATASLTQLALTSSSSTSIKSKLTIPSLLQLHAQKQEQHGKLVIRRDLLTGISLLPLVLSVPPPSLARDVDVGSFLPPSPSDPSMVLFKATSKDTPALRAGQSVSVTDD